MILAVRKCCCMGAGFEGDEGIKDRAGGNRRRRHAGVIGFLCRYTQGHLTCKWARIFPCQKWVLLNRCFELYKILSRFLIIRVNGESISSRSERLKWFPKPWESHSQSPKGEQILCVEFINKRCICYCRLVPPGLALSVQACCQSR